MSFFGINENLDKIICIESWSNSKLQNYLSFLNCYGEKGKPDSTNKRTQYNTDFGMHGKVFTRKRKKRNELPSLFKMKKRKIEEEVQRYNLLKKKKMNTKQKDEKNNAFEERKFKETKIDVDEKVCSDDADLDDGEDNNFGNTNIQNIPDIAVREKKSDYVSPDIHEREKKEKGENDNAFRENDNFLKVNDVNVPRKVLKMSKKEKKENEEKHIPIRKKIFKTKNETISEFIARRKKYKEEQDNMKFKIHSQNHDDNEIVDEAFDDELYSGTSLEKECDINEVENDLIKEMDTKKKKFAKEMGEKILNVLDEKICRNQSKISSLIKKKHAKWLESYGKRGINQHKDSPFRTEYKRLIENKKVIFEHKYGIRLENDEEKKICKN